ncbi:cytochrome P450 CYP72A219-like [Impatiens glandulifera]|uniref:cytochrome P450 CYP72A219-like n=1 Tax=Impatiens glandulifera TaxID=253017 RepID=UPI001FB0E757|nr:cytochrome P450 CYP72A219-like [Impatiens glandulifera]
MEILTLEATSLVLLLAVVITLIWKVINWVWIRPKRLEKLLRQQGLKGNPYRIFHGDLKELKAMVEATNSRPIDLSNDITSRVLPFHRHIIDNYGKNSYMWVGPIVRVNVMEPKLIKEILTNNKSFKKPPPIHPLANLLVAGLASYNDHKWAKHRRIINPAFHMQKLKNMFPLMYMSCNEAMKKLEILFENEKGSVEVDVQPYLEDLSTAVISRTLFGSSLYEEGIKIFRLQKDQAKLTRQVSTNKEKQGNKSNQ